MTRLENTRWCKWCPNSNEDTWSSIPRRHGERAERGILRLSSAGHPEHLTPLNFIFVQIFWWIQTRDGLEWSLWGSTEWAGRLQVMLLCCGHIMSCSSCSGGVTLTLQWLQKYCSIIFHILHSATLISNDQQSHLVAASISRRFLGHLAFD